MIQSAVFIDRDGTMGGDGGGIHPSQFKLFDGVIDSIEKLNKKKFLVFIITNQSRIHRGYFSEKEFIFHTQKLQSMFREQGVNIDHVFYCPHAEDYSCNCRKPKDGLIRQALKLYPNLSLPDSYIIGDNGEQDMVLGDITGMRKILVRTGKGNDYLTHKRHLWVNTSPDLIADDLNSAVDIIIQDQPIRIEC
ncbi:D-glycero-alpha-D-manno-heptose-1,7-bisphosphate 7-phosphatase [Bacillus cereus]|uniref:D-glycero-alpha-D-manno-heptose-1,7-bisphosphate 7-phosphatase n=1 Tax=Bacillus cereus TaxID=1396 RepID=UPI00065BD2A1|nr:HAD-IIIA family hydrolase [Bacillus cereus]KMQ32161.1 hypothetical protein TU58_01355 [Bacillus cereus]